MKKLIVAMTILAVAFVLAIPIWATGTHKALEIENRVTINPPTPVILDYCGLAKTNGAAAYLYGGYVPPIQTVTYFDPTVCPGVPTYPFEITSFSFTLYDWAGNTWPYPIDVVVYDMAVSGDPCQGPGAELCRFTVSCDQASFSYPNVGTAVFPQVCCVNEPFFIGLQYTSSFPIHPSILFDNQVPPPCDNWMFYADGVWYEWSNFWGDPAPGYPLFWVNGETPPNNCGQADCQNHKMHFPQLPDPNGWDVHDTDPISLADDWQCSETGPVQDIHFWGSWKGDIAGYVNYFIITIHSNIPVGPNGYSIPGDPLWGPYYFSDYTVMQESPSPQGWFDPMTGEVLPNDHQNYDRYNILLPEPMWFMQALDQVYWLRITAMVSDPVNTHWGWKSSQDHFLDDAVWAPGPFDPLPPWTELYEPIIPPETITNSFYIMMDPSGGFAGGGGPDAYGQGWYYYENFEWWNIWFYDHPLDPARMKTMTISGSVSKIDPNLPSFIEIAFNWSTSYWPSGGPPPIPPLDVPQEEQFIGRQTFFMQPDYEGPIDGLFEIMEYNPEWVSVDIRGYNFRFDGIIEHTCRPRDPNPQSLDLAFCITGGGLPQTGACCFPTGTCADLTEPDCNTQGGIFLGIGSVCLGDGNGNGIDDACEQVLGACCWPNGQCTLETQANCLNAGGDFKGNGVACMGDANGNGIDDLCEEANVPTLSEWGMIALLLLLITAGTVAIVRRRKEAVAKT